MFKKDEMVYVNHPHYPAIEGYAKVVATTRNTATATEVQLVESCSYFVIDNRFIQPAPINE